VRKGKAWNWFGIMCSGGVLTSIEPSVNPSAWGLLKPSSYCDVGRFFYRVFKFGAKLCRSLFKIM